MAHILRRDESIGLVTITERGKQSSGWCEIDRAWPIITLQKEDSIRVYEVREVLSQTECRATRIE